MVVLKEAGAALRAGVGKVDRIAEERTAGLVANCNFHKTNLAADKHK
jgi:hypothetical protein